MNRFVVAAMFVTCASGAARAHGTIPTSNSVSFGPDQGDVLLGTNFGGVLHVAGGDDRFLCERLVTGEQTSVGVWMWLGSGGVAGVVTTGGFIQGVYVSDDDACGFTVVPGSESLFMTDLAADPDSASGFYAVGATAGDSVEARFVRRSASGVELLASAADAVAITVRAAPGHAYSIFLVGDEARLIHVGPDGVETFVHARAAGETWQVLGVDPAAPETLWYVVSSAPSDVLYRSSDAGESATPILTVAGRLGGFAIGGQTVWVQSPQLGVHRSIDGGQHFEVLPKSPHGSCLARSGAGKLYACGVPWQDGMALGVSDDGQSFSAVIPYYDGIVGALDCASNPDGTTLCNEELDFLREYYGFSSPTTETSPEIVEAPVEPGPEPTAEAEAVESAAEVTEAGSGSDGCCGGGGVDASVLGLAGLVLGRQRKKVSARGGSPVVE